MRRRALDELRKLRNSKVFRGSSGGLVLRLFSLAMALITSVAMARLLGPGDYGTYTFAISIVQLLALLSALGFPRLLVREVAAFHAEKEWPLLRGVIRFSMATALIAALVVAVLSAPVAALLTRRSGEELLITFWISLALIPLTVMLRLSESSLRGLRQVVVGQISRELIRPCVHLLVLLPLLLLMPEARSPLVAASTQVLALIVAVTVGLILLVRRVPEEARLADPEYRPLMWIQSAAPLLALGSMQVIALRADIVMLGALSSADAVGIYRVASRGADLSTYVAYAANMAFQPAISRMYATGEFARLQLALRKGARLTFLGTTAVVIVLVLFGKWVLTNVFGPAFEPGYPTLVILVASQLGAAAMGFTASVLNMTGHERATLKGFLAAASLNLLLNGLLIPEFGATGAAVATGASRLVWNALLVWLSYRILGVKTAIV